MTAKIFRILYAAAACGALFTLNSCVSEPVIDGRTYIDYTGSRWAHYGLDSQKNAETARGALHRGFRISPLPGSDWIVNLSHQRPNTAEWTKPDLEDASHVTIAGVSATPVLPQKISQEELNLAAGEWIKKQTSDRIRDMKYTVSEGKRGETPTAELRAECTDVGTTPATRIFFEGFFCVTKQNQMLCIMVSEHSSKQDFKYTGENAAEFFRLLTW